MRSSHPLSSSRIMLLVSALTVVASAGVLLVLAQMGVVAYTGGGRVMRAFNLIKDHLGASVYFFMPVLIGYLYYFAQLNRQLSRWRVNARPQIDEKIQLYNSGTNLMITLFFAIGVLFTAWGMQNALVSALGGVSKSAAAEMGAWGILKRLVDNGILVALWSTIVGGGGGYTMRMVKFICLGKALNRLAVIYRQAENARVVGLLEAIHDQMVDLKSAPVDEKPRLSGQGGLHVFTE